MRQAAKKIVKKYSSDLDDTLGNELIRFGGLVAGIFIRDLENKVSPVATMYQMLIKRRFSDVSPMWRHCFAFI